MLRQSQPLWSQFEWLERAGLWVDAALEREGYSLSGSLEQVHVRPWSTVLRVPADGGDFYFKACAPALSHEAAVTQALYHWRPDCIPQVLQVDVAKGWMLMVDGGPRLREAFNNGLDKQKWKDVLALYASLQMDAAGHFKKHIHLRSSAKVSGTYLG